MGFPYAIRQCPAMAGLDTLGRSCNYLHGIMPLRALALGPKPLALPADTPVRAVLRAMIEHRINHVALVAGEGKFVGLASVVQALGKVVPASATAQHGLNDLAFVGDGLPMLLNHFRDLLDQPASVLMDPDAPVLPATTPLMEAALLLSRAPGPLPVLDENGVLLGILSQRALMQFLAGKAELSVFATTVRNG